MANHQTHIQLIWDIAELLRGPYKPNEYHKIVLPFTVLRRLDCILESTRAKVVETARSLPADIAEDMGIRLLNQAAGVGFHNTSPFTFETMLKDSSNLASNLVAYLAGFSPNLRGVFLDERKFEFDRHVRNLDGANRLFKVVERFARVPLHPRDVSNFEMGLIFEELIRKFAELSNEEAGDHFTPREVIRLMVDLLLVQDRDGLTRPGVIRNIYDPACGTGGMLSVAEEYIKELNPSATVELFGQEINGESFSVCRSDMVIKGQRADNIAFGDTLADDQFKDRRFHYMLSNPPFGVDWKAAKDEVEAEHEALGDEGRFGAGLPRISDGQLLFLQTMLAKMRNDTEGSRIGIVMNGSPLFTGSAGSGESEIRRWIIENDWLEAIVALPTQMFYNTGIQTYVWVLSNRKAPARQGKVQLVDASGDRFSRLMKKSLGQKRRELTEDGIRLVARIFGEALDGGGQFSEISRVMPSSAFGYRRIAVECPLRLRFEVDEDGIARLITKKAVEKLHGPARDELLATLREAMGGRLWMDRAAFKKELRLQFRAVSNLNLSAPLEKAILEALSTRDPEAAICTDERGRPEPDPELRDYEIVPYSEDIRAWFAREVLPHLPDAWIDERARDERDGEIGRVGYEINFNRVFYRYQPPRPLEVINRELRDLEAQIARLVRDIAA
jgi:type I restriction enzyme M protein